MRIPSDASIPPELGRIIGEIWRAIGQLQTARSGEHTAIGQDGIRVHSGGGITIEDGGRFVARYPGGQRAVTIGPANQGPGVLHGTGLYVRGREDQQVFWATHASDGRTEVVMGVNEDRVGRIYSRSIENFSNTYGLHRIQTHDGAEIEILSDGRMWLYTDGELTVDASGNALVQVGGTMQFLSTGAAALAGDAGTYLQPESTGNAANVHMDVDGRVFRSTSSRRYKTDIRDLAVDPDAVLRLQPRSWLPGAVPHCCPEWRHAQHSEDEECPADQAPAEPAQDADRVVGFVAEELVELGLHEFVEFNSEGLPEAIYYDRLTAVLVPLAQRQQEQINDLTTRVTELEALILG